MIKKHNETHLYLKPENNTLSISDFSGEAPNDIILDLNHFEEISNDLGLLILDINKKQVEKGFCLVVVTGDKSLLPKDDLFVVTPTLSEATDYLQMERIQRDLGF